MIRSARKVLTSVAVVLGLSLVVGAGSAVDARHGNQVAKAPIKGGKLVIAVDAEPTGFDPGKNSVPTAGAGSITTTVFSALTAPTKDGRYVPFLAQSVEPNKDSTVWTIKLRKGARFQDGTLINAAAIKFNLERMKKDGFAGWPDIKTVTAIAAWTVSVKLTKSVGTFPVQLASQLGWIYSPTAQKALGADFSSKPVGSGPFRLVKWVRGSSLVLKKNQYYWRKGMPYLDEIEFRVIVDPAARLAALKAGDVDAAQIEPADLPAVKGSDYVTRLATAGVNLIYINSAKSPLDDVRVRRAMAHALNRKAILSTVWRGVGTIADSPAPLGNPFRAKVQFPAFDLAKAKSLVAAYKAATGKTPSFTLSLANDSTSQLLAQIVQSQWKQAGIDVTLGAPAQAGAHAGAVITNAYQAATFGFPAFLDPDVWWSAIFMSNGVLSVMNYDDPIIDAALTRAHALSDVSKRKAQYAIVQQRLASRVYAIFLRGNVVAEAARSYVKGMYGWTLPDGTPAPYGQDYRMPFRVESLWRSK